MSKLNEIHIRLKTVRMASGYRTATEFCEENNIPVSTYNMHETGKRKILADVAEKYAKILAVNTTWLITGSGSPYANSSSITSSNLTPTEYLNLLNYNDNHKSSPQSMYVLPQKINAALFCKIITEIVEVLSELNTCVDIRQICHYATEIYQDIVQTSTVEAEQLTMVNLAMTIFKRSIHQAQLHERSPSE